MDLRERITIATGCNTDLDRLIAFAYWVGCHDGAKRVCDKHGQFVKAMRDRANASRYHKFANAIIGDKKNDLIYDGDYDSNFPDWEMDGNYPRRYDITHNDNKGGEITS
jgi:hypothetical protein